MEISLYMLLHSDLLYSGGWLLWQFNQLNYKFKYINKYQK